MNRPLQKQSPASKKTLVILAGIVLLGIVLRLAQYIHNRELWLDEAYLSVELLTKTYCGITGELRFNMVFPVGYLFVEKFAASLLGTSEYALRLPSLVCGLLALPAFAGLCLAAGKAPSRNTNQPCETQTAHWIAIAVAMLFFATSKHLVYYTSEVRQYILDVLAVCVVYWIVIPEVFARQTDYQGQCRRFFVASCFGAVATWIVLAPIFVWAAIGTVYLVQDIAACAWRRLPRTILAGAVWTLSFAVHMVWLQHIMTLGDRTADIRYRIVSLSPPIPPQSTTDLQHLWDSFKHFFEFPGGFTEWGLPFFVLAAGCVVMWRRSRALSALLILPVPYALFASAIHRYPFRNQYILFLMPAVFLLMAYGIAHFLRNAERGERYLGALLLVLMMLHPAIEGLRVLEHYRTGPGGDCVLRPLVKHLRTNWRQGDLLLVEGTPRPFFEYAGPVAGFDRRLPPTGIEKQFDCDPETAHAYVYQPDAGGDNPRRFTRLAEPSEPVPPSDRIWLIASPGKPPGGMKPDNGRPPPEVSLTTQTAQLRLFELAKD